MMVSQQELRQATTGITARQQRRATRVSEEERQRIEQQKRDIERQEIEISQTKDYVSSELERLEQLRKEAQADKNRFSKGGDSYSASQVDIQIVKMTREINALKEVQGELGRGYVISQTEAKRYAEESGIAGATSKKLQYESRALAESQAKKIEKQLSELKAQGLEPIYVKGKITGFEDVKRGQSVPLEKTSLYLKQLEQPKVTQEIPKTNQQPKFLSVIEPAPNIKERFQQRVKEKGYVSAIVSTPFAEAGRYIKISDIFKSEETPKSKEVLVFDGSFNTISSLVDGLTF